MTKVVEMGYDGQEAFRRDVEKVIFDLIECLYKHYGQEAGAMMARAFSAALLGISEEVLKRLEDDSGEGEAEQDNQSNTRENVIPWPKK